MPWLYSLVGGGLNSSYSYGNNDGISPVVLSPAQGFNFTAGSPLTITFAGGAISLGTGISANDASGNPSFTANNPQPGIAPSYYMSNVASPIYLGELVGTFTNGAGTIVGIPFAIGDGPATVYVPAGAAQLQLGVNATVFSNNTGFWLIQVSASAGSANPTPAISSISPSSVPPGSGPLTVTINGGGFIQGSTASVNGNDYPVTFLSANQLTIVLAASDVASAGTTFYILVTNPPPGGGSSLPATFTVQSNPSPSVTSLSPSAAAVGTGFLTVIVNGTGFVPASSVTLNGIGEPVAFVGPTQLKVFLTASDLSTLGTLPLIVTNPTPGGGVSQPFNFTVSSALNPAPAITGLSPSSAAAASGPITLVISGTGFLASSTVTVNGVSHAATLNSSAQITIQLTASDLVNSGSLSIVVTNPAPGGSSSTPAVFTVSPPVANPVPAITSLSPSSLFAGSSGTTLSINGSGFLASSVVTFNGVAHSVSFISSTQLNITLTPSDLTTTGSFSVVVTNPPPGGSSSPVTFSVALNPAVPSINSGGIINAGSLPNAVVAPGSIASIYGNFPGVSSTQSSATPWPTTLSGLSIQFGGTSAPIAFVSPQLTNIQVPWELSGQTQAKVVATVGNQTSQTQTVRLATYAPGIFITNAQGQGAVVDSSNTLVDSSNPAIAGSTVIQIYSTGLGTVTNQPATGSPAPLNTLAQTTVSPTVEIGGVTANVLFSGLTPGSVGLYQVNAQVPLGTTPGSAVPVFISIGGFSSNTVTIAVKSPPPPEPQPAITSLSPSSAPVGSAQVSLTINGSGFLNSSTLTFNGISHPVSFISATQLQTTLTAADLSASGSFNVVVTNPAPGGGDSQPAAFTVTIPVPITGNWTGTWFSTQFQTGGSISAVFSQTGSSVSGTVLFNGSSCSLANVNGTVAGTQLSATGSAGSQSLTLTGTIGSGNTAIQGSYGLSAGPCAPAGDSGTFTLIQSH